jgi:uncharacterized protein YdaU (DUF1376 family)
MAKIRRVDLSFDEFIAGTIGLTDVEMGIYWRAILLIYNGGGRALQKAVRRMCSSDPRVYKPAINALVSSGKLTIEGDYFVNNRCTSELQLARNRSISSSQNVSKRWAKYRENKKTADTAVIQAGNAIHQPSTIKVSATDVADPPLFDTPPIKPAEANQAGRGSRIAPDWTPDLIDRQFAAERGLDADEVAGTFRDHWVAKAGADACKRDWHAVWRNWCRRTPEFTNGSHQRPASGSRPGEDRRGPASELRAAARAAARFTD